MSTRPTDELAITIAQLNSTVGDILAIQKRSDARAPLPLAPMWSSFPSCLLRVIHLRTWCSNRLFKPDAAPQSKPLRVKPPRRVQRSWLEHHGSIAEGSITPSRYSTAARSQRSALRGRPSELRGVR